MPRSCSNSLFITTDWHHAGTPFVTRSVGRPIGQLGSFLLAFSWVGRSIGRSAGRQPSFFDTRKADSGDPLHHMTPVEGFLEMGSLLFSPRSFPAAGITINQDASDRSSRPQAPFSQLSEAIESIKTKMSADQELIVKSQKETEQDLVSTKHHLLEVRHQLTLAEKVRIYVHVRMQYMQGKTLRLKIPVVDAHSILPLITIPYARALEFALQTSSERETLMRARQLQHLGLMHVRIVGVSGV